MNKLKFPHLFIAYAVSYLAANDFASRVASQTFNSIFEFCNERQTLPDPGFECTYGPNMLLYAIQAWFVFVVMYFLLSHFTKLLSLVQVLALTVLLYAFLTLVYLGTSYWEWITPLNDLVDLPFDGGEYVQYYAYIFKEVIFAGIVAGLFVKIFGKNKFKFLKDRAKKAKKLEASEDKEVAASTDSKTETVIKANETVETKAKTDAKTKKAPAKKKPAKKAAATTKKPAVKKKKTSSKTK